MVTKMSLEHQYYLSIPGLHGLKKTSTSTNKYSLAAQKDVHGRNSSNCKATAEIQNGCRL